MALGKCIIPHTALSIRFVPTSAGSAPKQNKNLAWESLIFESMKGKNDRITINNSNMSLLTGWKFRVVICSIYSLV